MKLFLWKPLQTKRPLIVWREAIIYFEEGIDRELEYQNRTEMVLLQQSIASGSLHVPSQEVPSKPIPASRKRKAVHEEPRETLPKGSHGRSLLLREETLACQAPPLQIPLILMPSVNQNPSSPLPVSSQPWSQVQTSLYHPRNQQHPEQQSQDQSYYQPQNSKAALVWCNLCKLNCMTLHNLKIHMEGKKHKANLDKQSPKGKHKSRRDELSLRVECSDDQPPPKTQPVLAWCDVCEVNCKNPQNLNRHLQGSKHKAKSDKQYPTSERAHIPSEAYQQVNYSEEEQHETRSSPVWCTLCKVNCMNLENLRRHLLGKKHKERWNGQPLQACHPDSQQPL